METIMYFSTARIDPQDLVSVAKRIGITDVRVGDKWMQFALPDGAFCTFEKSTLNSTDGEYRGLEDTERDSLLRMGFHTWFLIQHHVDSFRYCEPILKAVLNEYGGQLFLGAITEHDGFSNQQFEAFEKAYRAFMVETD